MISPSADLPPYVGKANTFEGVIAEVERNVAESARAMLFTGEDLRLEILLTRWEDGPRVVWGIKGHEDWAFKATVLRFVHGRDPVHILLEERSIGTRSLRGWVIGRKRDCVWASPLSIEHVMNFYTRFG